MATYTPASFPTRPSPKQSNLFTELKYQAELAYYQFEVNTAQYVMSPGEKLAYNFVLFGALALMLSAVWVYLPVTLTFGLRKLGFYLTGGHQQRLQQIAINKALQGAVRVGHEATASLMDSGSRQVINASVRAFP